MIADLIKQRDTAQEAIYQAAKAFLMQLHAQGGHAPSVTPMGHGSEYIKEYSIAEDGRFQMEYESGCGCGGFDIMYMYIPLEYIDDPSPTNVAQYIADLNAAKEKKEQAAKTEREAAQRAKDLADYETLQQRLYGSKTNA